MFRNNDFGFKFKIGEYVRHVGSDLINDTKEIYISRNEKFFVVGRVLEECPGGIQRHYDVRPLVLGSPATKLVRFNEIELMQIQKEI